MDKKNKHLDYIELPAKSAEELKRTRDFLSEVFGWQYTMYGDNYADTADSGVSSGVNAENPTSTVLPVIYVTDLQKTFDKIKEEGAEILREIFPFPGGKRFHFREPSGNELAVWSDK